MFSRVWGVAAFAGFAPVALDREIPAFAGMEKGGEWGELGESGIVKKWGE